MSDLQKKEDEFYALARNGRFPEAIQFLSLNPELARLPGVLASAACTFPIEILAKVVELGADLNQVDSMGYSVIAYAVGRGRIESVEYLLRHGAAPNIKTAISFLVDDPLNRRPTRFDILKLMVRYGADINQKIETLEGCNLWVKASDYEDYELLELVEKLGGKPTQEYLDDLENEEVELNLDTFEDRLVDALRIAWTEIVATRPNETFFMFGIETDDDRVLLTPFCNTEETAELENPEIKEYPLAKWAVMPESSLYGAGQEHIEELATELNQGAFADDNWNTRKQNRVTKIFENSLVRLDSEGLFGKGQKRERVILSVAICDADSKGEKEMLRIMKRINPPESLKPYFEAEKQAKRRKKA